MTKYLKSEFYRILHFKWTYLFIAICSVLLIASNVVLAAVNLTEPNFRYANTSFSISNFNGNIVIIFVLCIMVVSMISGNENGNHTLKNSVSYGITRGTIYFGKLTIEIVYAVISYTIITGIHVASAYLLLENSGVDELNELLHISFVCLPLLLFALAATNCFVFILEGAGAAVGATVLFTLAFPLVSQFLGMKFIFFEKLSKVLPWNMMNSIGKGDTGDQNFWIYGILQMMIIALVGYIIFRQKEVK